MSEHAHVVNREAGDYSAIAGLVPHLVEGERGHPMPLPLRRAVLAREVHRPRQRLMWLESTNNRAGGTVMTVDHLGEITAAARDASLKVHLDGARTFNAACVLGVEPDRLTTGVDSV